MRRAGAIVAILMAATVGMALIPASDPAYQVRAYFDSAGFLVPGEEVRAAGAKVGTVAAVDVAMPGEAVTVAGGEAPGKAVVVLDIEDPAFQDFRRDASCLIRPQSLLGERYVECRPTSPRAPGAAPPPELEAVPADAPGEGQLVLPLERTGKQVDLDVVQNVMRLPYRERFRIVLNELGAGLAARGPELAAVIERANPALRETDRVLATLASQRRALERLAADASTALGPIDREREEIGAFLRASELAGGAAAERLTELEAGLELLPGYLDELEPTMGRLSSFARASLPVVRDLKAAAPSIERATLALGPFSRSTERALLSLGEAASETQAPLLASQAVLRRLERLASRARPAARGLDELLTSFARTGGDRQLFNLIYNSAGAVNGYDSFGHFLRAQLLVTNCVDYVVRPLTGCGANWAGGAGSFARSSPEPLIDFLMEDG